MNSRQHRKAKRAFLRKYPYLVDYALDIYGNPEPWDWCCKNVKKGEWEAGWVVTPRGVGRIRGFRFTHSKDAMVFSLRWL